jgi:hypothetical protein
MPHHRVVSGRLVVEAEVGDFAVVAPLTRHFHVASATDDVPAAVTDERLPVHDGQPVNGSAEDHREWRVVDQVQLELGAMRYHHDIDLNLVLAHLDLL